MSKFVLTKSPKGQLHFSLKADNGEKILSSETYKSKAGALKGIESVKKNSALDARFERRVSKAGRPYFVLRAGNHEIIGTSEEYNSEEARENGIASVMREAQTAPTDDQAL